jgi:hypothetical protein
MAKSPFLLRHRTFRLPMVVATRHGKVAVGAVVTLPSIVGIGDYNKD